MIITVTMNPAIDKTIELEQLVHGGLNRIKRVLLDAGGKGINVSKTIKGLGGETVALGFVAGNNGRLLREQLEKQGIMTDFLNVAGETRVNTKVVEANGVVTELNEPGPDISEDDLKRLFDKLLCYAKKDMWFVLSGSVPKGVPKTVYRDLIEKIHAKKGLVFLDAEGELLSYGLEAKPDAIKPNRAELEQFTGGKEQLNEEELFAVGRSVVEKGIKNVIISLGEEGALFLSKEKQLKVYGIPIEVRSTVGAGDAMVAAFVYGMEKKALLSDCVRIALATATAAVATVGTGTAELELIEKLKNKVVIEKR